MNQERLDLHGEMEEGNKGAAQFTQAGSPSSFPLDDFARSLPDDNLREILSNIKPLKRKTYQDLKIEQTNNMPIEVLVFSLYWVDKKSMREVAREAFTSRDKVERIMLRSGIPRRDMSTAKQIVFENENRKREIVAKIHTQESDEKRENKMRQWFIDHAEERNMFALASLKARRKNLERREQQVREALGVHPEFALFRLHYIEGYSVAEISARTSLKESKIRSLMREHGVKNLDKRPEVEGKYIAVVNPLLDIFYKKEAGLTSSQEYVIYRRYVDPEYKLSTLEEVGRELGVTREAVRKIEERAIKNLSSVATKSRASAG